MNAKKSFIFNVWQGLWSVFLCILLVTAHSAVAQTKGDKAWSLLKTKPVSTQPLKGMPHHKLASSLQATIVKSQVPISNLGIVVAHPDTMIYALNKDKEFIPASLAKIFIASALLDLLSPTLRFRTQFLATKKLKGFVLNGDLYLKGGGDPSFVSESLWNLVNNLKRTGIKTVKGDLIVDDSRFDKKYHRGSDEFGHLSYNAPVGALSFNWNVANVYVRPGKKVESVAQVFVDPSELYFANIKNNSKTIKKGKSSLSSKVDVFKPHSQQTNIPHQVRQSLSIMGDVVLGQKETLLYNSVSRPDLWAGWNAISFLQQRGIKVLGREKKTKTSKKLLAKLESIVRSGKTPLKAQLLAQWEGKTLTENIRLMMKYSNNFMVDMLIKNLAVQKSKKNQKTYIKKGNFFKSRGWRQGTLKRGIKILKRYMKNTLHISKGYRLVHPSGLSRKNRIRPHHLWQVLQYWLAHPLQAEFESALPIAGLDGTLEERLQTLKGRVHAKTGSLNGVVGLAGYLQKKNGQKVIFVFMFNGDATFSLKISNLFDKLLHIIDNT